MFTADESQRPVRSHYLSWFGLLAATTTTALAIWLQTSSPIDPFPSYTVARVEISPPHEKDPLRSAEHILQDLYAPEDGFALDHGDDDWIWSLGNGELRQVNMKTMTSKKFAQTGEPHELCGALFMEEHCGRPLGLFKLPLEDQARYQQYVPDSVKEQKPLFLVADAYKGLLLVLSGGEVVTLLTSVQHKPIYFANAQLFAALPGLPDNIHVSYVKEWERSVLWVGLGSKSSIITKILNSAPNLRKLLASFPPKHLLKFFKRYGIMLAIDAETGQTLYSYQDPDGRTPYIAGIHFDEKYGYIGSWKNHFLAKIPREELFSVNLDV